MLLVLLACATLSGAAKVSPYTLPCPIFAGPPVGGSTGLFVDLNGDGLKDVVYSFSKGNQQGEYTAAATFLNTGKGYCLEASYPEQPKNFYALWRNIVGMCVAGAVELYPPCPARAAGATRFITPCALFAYYPQTYGTVQHGTLVDVTGDGLPEMLYAYAEGVADSAQATFLNLNGTFCLSYAQEIFQDQCLPNASKVFKPCPP